jgi:ABC-type transport system substrate-binding protein
MSRCSTWYRRKSPSPPSCAPRLRWRVGRLGSRHRDRRTFGPRVLIALLAIVTLFVWPAGLAAAPEAGSFFLITAAFGQRSVLDVDEDEKPPASNQPDAPVATDEAEPSRASEEPELPELREMGEEEEEEESERDVLMLDEAEEEPLGARDRRARAARADSLETPTAEEAAEEEARKAEVYDVLFWRPDRGSTGDIPIVLYPDYLRFPLPPQLLRKQFEFQPWTATGQAKRFLEGRQIARISYYEKRLGDQAAKEVGLASLDALAEPGKLVDLGGRAEAYKRAEKLLRTAIAQHDSAVQRSLRKGPGWNEHVRTPLVEAMVNLRLSRVDQLFTEGLYGQAQTECDRLAGELGERESLTGGLRRRYEQILQARAAAAFDQDDYVTVRQLLDLASARLDGKLGETGAGVQRRLMDQAAALMRQAEQLKAAKPQEALDRLDEAMRIWPALPGLDEQRRRLVGDYPILHCAYTELPRTLSPLEAQMPVERHAVSLVYESLVRWVDHPASGSHYECRLAQGRPVPLERGRGFYLPRCFWVDGESGRAPCTVEDVRWTVKLLVNRQRSGYSPATARLLDGVQNSPDNDPHVALVTLERDHWQPLALMDFRVLHHPELSQQQELEEELERLRRQPVGTGPYRYLTDGDPDVLRLVANPAYREAGRPKIREIVFHRLEPTAARDRFLEGKIHLIYGVRPQHAIQLRDQGKRVVCLKTPTVWFLAPNYRRPALENKNLRLAIAHAIRREEILDQYFRLGGDAADHVVLTGPYPVDSWACRRDLSLFHPRDDSAREAEAGRAKALAERARRDLQPSDLSLRLVYPAGLEEVQQACQQISAHVAEVGITLELVPVAERDFYQRVVEQHDFDLAYWRHDFEDPTYWLEPLLDQDPDAQRPGGPNFMGYPQDEAIRAMFDEINLHKHFPQIRQATHEIHAHVAQNAIVIPLWQLGTYVAVSSGVRPKGRDGNAVALDPFDLFANVEQWELEAPPSR